MRIVLVDPSRTMLKYVSRLLEARGHEARIFTDGHEALAAVRSDPAINAVVTSSELVSMTGVELCWEARLLASNRRPIYVILMSSNQHCDKLIEALDSGADDFIGKPPVAEELYARLRAAERLVSMQRELVRLATTDPLTGALNRRAFFELAAEACARAERRGALSAIMFDIDHFKQINDRFGHDAGDRAIRAVAAESARDGAVVGRLGGEEFALLIEHEPGSAAATAECLRARIAALRFEDGDGAMKLTCSFGVSDWQAGDTIDRMLKRADVALYAAKTSGRNRVVAASPALDASLDGANGSGVIRAAVA